jgi:hypothetical protein
MCLSQRLCRLRIPIGESFDRHIGPVNQNCGYPQLELSGILARSFSCPRKFFEIPLAPPWGECYSQEVAR